MQEAVGEARACHLQTAIESGKEYQKAGLLGKALIEAKRAVEIDERNPDAIKLKGDIQEMIAEQQRKDDERKREEEQRRKDVERRQAAEQKKKEAESAALARSSGENVTPPRRISHKPKRDPVLKTVTLPGGTTMEFAYCEPGTFNMGSSKFSVSDEGEEEHHVEIRKGFWMGRFEVTQHQWQSVMRENPSFFVDGTRPVENVSISDIEKFLRKVSKLIPSVRLPTEEEWEYACRAGSGTSLPNGLPMMIFEEHHAPELDSIAWYGGNSSVGCDIANAVDCTSWKGRQYDGKKAATHPVGKKVPNDFGLYDMIGNVWEISGTTKLWVLRGGAWNSRARDCRVARRKVYSLERDSAVKDNAIGFRICADDLPQ